MELLRAAPRSDLHVSVSQLKAYVMCPRKYELRYVRGAEAEHRSANLVLGSAVHEALAAYYAKYERGMKPTAGDVLAAFCAAFDEEAVKEPPVLLDAGETLGQLKDSGVALVRAFLDNVAPPERVLGVERAFHVDVVDPATGEVLEEQLVGYLDAVVEDAGRLLVLEHKTAARAWSQDQLEHDVQVGLYQAATGVDAVRLQVLTKTKAAKMLVHDLARNHRQQVEAVEVVCHVLKAIRAGAFWRQRGWACKECEFRVRCAAA